MLPLKILIVCALISNPMRSRKLYVIRAVFHKAEFFDRMKFLPDFLFNRDSSKIELRVVAKASKINGNSVKLYCF